eukprot:TRINITY_DN951_c0_g1_i1.p1 TRINITY_DN951_c0_g1~~TRINITY_DN951_c0_g1_i1.p1  ORF type:complete len:825 (-),score=136.29 TRINITY_DN951_c0_g1_i1:11066-13540(-)
MYTCGAGDAGQLGSGRREREFLPQKVAAIPEKSLEVAAGLFHTFAVGETGSLWAMGGNSFGQLGLGHKKGSVVPVKVAALTHAKIKKVSCGHHTAAITYSGELYVWGTGVFGELLLPQKVASIEKITDISVGGSFGIALDHTGKLWTWGANTSGELGVGDYEPRASPVPLEKLAAKSVIGISCGGAYALALGITHVMGQPEPTKTFSHAADTIPTRNDHKMDSVITRAINQSLNESIDSLCIPPDKPQEGMFRTSYPEEYKEPRIIVQKNPPQGKKQRTQNPIMVLHEAQAMDIRSISEANTIDLISSVSQRDPHQPLLAVLAKQRDYLEEALEKERKERKRSEDEANKFKAEYNRLKMYTEQIETQKEREKTELENLLNTYALHKGRMEELEPRIVELENANELLNKMLKEKEEEIGEVMREKEEVTKKYANAKAKLKAHIETQSKLAKENDNIMKKLRILELSSGSELQELRSVNEALTEKIEGLESQLKELSLYKQKTADKLQEYDQKLNESQENVMIQNDAIQKLEKEKAVLQNEFAKQKEAAGLSQDSLCVLQKELEAIKVEITAAESVSRQDLDKAQKKIEDLTEENLQLKSRNEELTSSKAKVEDKAAELEAEVKAVNAKLIQSKKMNEELEERNYKLMDALHQDVTNRTKQYKGRTLATLAQCEIKENIVTTISEAKGSEKAKETDSKNQFSFREPFSKGKGVSPPQNLVVESADDITLFDSLHKPTAGFAIPDQPKDNIENKGRRMQSPAKLIPREEPIENKVPPLDPNRGRKGKSQKPGIVSKLQDFEQRLRDSLSKVANKKSQFTYYYTDNKT